MCSTEVEVEVKFANLHIHPAQLHLSAQGYHLQITAAGGNTEYFPSETRLHVREQPSLRGVLIMMFLMASFINSIYVPLHNQNKDQ